MKLESTLRPRGGLLHFVSMLDIVFLLLLFFLLNSNAVVRSGIAVKPPQSRSALQAAAAADIVTVTASDPPQLFFNDRLVSLEELDNELADGSGEGGRKQIVLRGDEMATYGTVIEISNLVVAHGYSLILATRPEISE